MSNNVIYIDMPGKEDDHYCPFYGRGYSLFKQDGFFIMVKWRGFTERMVANGEVR